MFRPNFDFQSLVFELIAICRFHYYDSLVCESIEIFFVGSYTIEQFFNNLKSVLKAKQLQRKAKF
jgi:hypothetical protein